MLRLLIFIFSISVPLALLLNNIYGSFLFSFSLPVIWQICLKGASFSSLGFRKQKIGFSIFLGIVSGCILGLTGGQLFRLLGMYRLSFQPNSKIQFTVADFTINLPLNRELGYKFLKASESIQGLLFYLIFIIFVIGLGEELFWRGFLQQKLNLRFSKYAAILLTSLLFALSHIYLFSILSFKDGVFSLCLIALAGIFWGYLYEYTQNIWTLAFSHGIAAFIIWKYFFFAV